MRLIDADALIADLLTVDPRYTEMVEWCCNVIRQTPTIEPTDTDIISRVDAIDALSRSSVYAWSIEQDQTAHNWALNIIKALPSANAEQGVWEHIESTLADNMFKCSKCGNPLIIPTVDGEPIYKYCLHCGAKMGNAWGERND